MSLSILLSSIIFSLLLQTSVVGYAHEVRPGYLEITKLESGKYKLLWKAPCRPGMRMRIKPVLPDIPLALFCFNVGVEIGQIIFVVMVLIVMGALKKMQLDLPPWCKPLPVYAMGSVAAFWFIGRLVVMF